MYYVGVYTGATWRIPLNHLCAAAMQHVVCHITLTTCYYCYYLCQGEYVFVVVCLTVSNLVQKFPNRFAWNFRECWQWASEQIINFWWQSKSQIRIWICIVTLVRCALVEVCTVPVVLVIIVIIITDWLILLILQYQVLDLYRNTVKHMKHKKTFNIT